RVSDTRYLTKLIVRVPGLIPLAIIGDGLHTMPDDISLLIIGEILDDICLRPDTVPGLHRLEEADRIRPERYPVGGVGIPFAPLMWIGHLWLVRTCVCVCLKD